MRGGLRVLVLGALATSACSSDRIQHGQLDAMPLIASDATPADAEARGDGYAFEDGSTFEDAFAPDADSPDSDVPPDADAPDASPDAAYVVPDANAFPPVCGDNSLSLAEECEDGNIRDGDGCDSQCVREFRIRTLTATNCSAAYNHRPLTQGDSGALVTTSTSVFYSGDVTARFDLDLSMATVVSATLPNRRLQALVSDLRTGTAYTLADANRPMDGRSAGRATQIWEVSPIDGATVGSPIALTQSITFPQLGESGIFSGWGFAIFHTGDHVHEVALPSGRVTDLGPMNSIRSDATGCATFALWGVAESFGGHRYLVSTFKPSLPVTQIKRHRIPDGATTVIAEFTDLGNACSIAVSPGTSRWYTQWNELSQLGGGIGTDSIAFCDADIGPGSGDGIIRYPGISKRPFSKLWSPLSPAFGAYVFANSFVASSTSTYVERLGLWLVDEAGTGGADLFLQVLGETAAQRPDPTRVIARTAVFHPTSTSVIAYVEAPVVTWTQPLVQGQRYWFAASVVGQAGPGQWAVARHANNTDGIVDDGRLMFSGERQGSVFEPPDNSTHNEIAFQVQLGSNAFDSGVTPDSGP